MYLYVNVLWLTGKCSGFNMVDFRELEITSSTYYLCFLAVPDHYHIPNVLFVQVLIY